MKIGLLVTSISNFGTKGFYNVQEIGLAKALARSFGSVDVYKLIPFDKNGGTETLEGYNNVTIHTFSAKSFGINGFVDTGCLDTTLDALIYFSDTQFALPKVYKWTKKHNIKFFPYIGVTESHSTSKIKKAITDFMFSRNIRVYRKCCCFSKTPCVCDSLGKLGINQVTVAPVGLDLELLKSDYASYDTDGLKEKYGFLPSDKILLFIGRLIEEKQPVRMVNLLKKLCDKGLDYKLLMVGKGELGNEIDRFVKNNALSDRVRRIEQIPNSDIWELYRISKAFVNLNEQEIFGMAILEAMYYECKTVACKAPGPEYIINNDECGFIATTDDEILGAIESEIVPQAAHNRIVDEFVWENTAKIFADVINKYSE